MNVSCTKCSARYMVPDGRVQGRKVRIRCKQCGEQIVIDQSGQDAATSPPEPDSQAPGGSSVEAPENAVKPGRPLGAPRPGPPKEPAKLKSTRSTIMGGLRAPGLARTASALPRQEVLWTVALGDEERIETTTSGVLDLYQAGRIDDQVFIWRDGMETWATLPEIEELRTALQQQTSVRRISPPSRAAQDKDMPKQRGPKPPTAIPRPGSGLSSKTAEKPGGSGATLGLEPSSEGGREPLFSDDELTLAIDAPYEARARPMAQLTPLAEAVDADERETLPPPDSTPPPDSVVPLSMRDLEAVREVPPPRRLPELSEYDIQSSPSIQRPSFLGGDLFGAEPIARRVRPSMPGNPAPTQEKTGERGENSVLFSLDALVAAGKGHTEPQKKADPFGNSPFSTQLGLGTPLGGAAPPRPPISIMQPVDMTGTETRASILSAQGEFDAALLTAPRKRSLGWLWAVLLVLGGAALPFAFMPDARTRLLASLGYGPRVDTAAETSGIAPGAEHNTEKPSAEAPVATPPRAAPETTTSSAASAAKEEPAPKAPEKTKPEAADSRGQDLPERPTPAGGPKPGADRPSTPTAGTLEPKPSEPKPTEPKPSEPTAEPSDEGGEAPPFNVTAAGAALSQAAASAASCQQPGGASGAGRARVTFSNSGRATTALISGDLAGTSVGGCVARLFQRSRVPPFSGPPVSVTKSFNVP